MISKITKFCKTRMKTLTKKEKHFLTNYIPKTSNFYGLPRFNKKRSTPTQTHRIHCCKKIKKKVKRERKNQHQQKRKSVTELIMNNNTIKTVTTI